MNDLLGTLTISGSKSESNRLLILQALSQHAFPINNLSEADDTRILADILNQSSAVVNVGIAGTAMRFLTAYYAVQVGKETYLTGEDRMLERPIGILVEALKTLGADILYTHKEGFPPLRIIGKSLTKQFVSLPASTSSQFITALMLIAPFFSHGLTLQLTGRIISMPYLHMTLQLLKRLHIACHFSGNTIQIHPATTINTAPQQVESDWSSASYYYSLIALSGGSLTLNNFCINSLQGDKFLATCYRSLGVSTTFEKEGLILHKSFPFVPPTHIVLDLSHTPDLAQTIAVSCAALKIRCTLQGLSTLIIKETNRLVALQNELLKFGVITAITDNSLEILDFKMTQENILLNTYNDHRMAMAFAPLLYLHNFEIENPSVVSKSYPYFWKDFTPLLTQLKSRI